MKVFEKEYPNVELPLYARRSLDRVGVTFGNHLMNKLVEEVGLSTLITLTTGNSGSDMIKETAKSLSSTAFDRSLEKDADIKSVDFLIKAKINPEPFTNFLYKLAERDNEATK